MSDQQPILRKWSVIIPISEELLRPGPDRDGHLEPPAAEDVAAYRKWKAKFAPLFREGERHGWFSAGGPDYGFEYQPPEDRWVFDDD